MTTVITYRSSDLAAARAQLDAEEDALGLDAAIDAELAICREHVATAAAADVLVFDLGDDIVARAVMRPGARIVREYLGESL